MNRLSWLSGLVTGLIVIAPSATAAELVSVSSPLETLPNGMYQFSSRPIGPGAANQAVQLAKYDNVVIGQMLTQLDGNSCFAGLVEQNQIVEVKYAHPPYGSDLWTFSGGPMQEPIDLNAYPYLTSLGDLSGLAHSQSASQSAEDSLHDCITAFALLIEIGGDNALDELEGFMFSEGSLDARSPVLESDGSRYRPHYFSGQAGQTVTVVLVSEEIDPYLIVLGPAGEKLAENDDASQTDANSQVTFVLPQTGTYQIIANSYSANDYGSYLVVVKAE